MEKNRYLLSFTAAGLSLGESIKIAEVYLGCNDWDETKKVVQENNLLQSRTNARTTRAYQELSKRLKLLSNEQLDLLAEGNIQEQKHMLWFTICNRYEFIREFAIEVIHEKFLVLDFELTELDYDSFFNRKVDWHEELDEITTTTKKKLKQVVFRMLREAGITTEKNRIIQTLLSERLIKALSLAAPMNYKIFPLQLSDIER